MIESVKLMDGGPPAKAGDTCYQIQHDSIRSIYIERLVEDRRPFEPEILILSGDVVFPPEDLYRSEERARFVLEQHLRARLQKASVDGVHAREALARLEATPAIQRLTQEGAA